jgi:hypothetical protein
VAISARSRRSRGARVADTVGKGELLHRASGTDSVRHDVAILMTETSKSVRHTYSLLNFWGDRHV